MRKHKGVSLKAISKRPNRPFAKLHVGELCKDHGYNKFQVYNEQFFKIPNGNLLHKLSRLNQIMALTNIFILVTMSLL